MQEEINQLKTKISQIKEQMKQIKNLEEIQDDEDQNFLEILS